ncbi:MAG: threonine synthase [Candidatus Undinarchaeales archaeon]|jgi:threonine synthase|nr:threonine synthase [Candidatus Undinarchaeales archaeon]MDP7492614.1 threonine synthase [Candidatus Undinarchaeales archaeon]
MLRCIACDREIPDGIRYTCDCGGLLEVRYDLAATGASKEAFASRPPGVWRYRELLPVAPDVTPVSLEEGNTGLHRCKRLASELGSGPLWMKNEGENPTGSFKDRGMTVGVTVARELGASFVGCASTGNTSASLSAYAARSGMRCLVILPVEKIAKGKLSQAIAHGAEIIGIEGGFDVAMRLIKEACDRYDIYLLNSLNPYRLEGQKTLGFEVVEALGWEVPDWIVLPVGNAGNISAIWKGLKELRELGIIDRLPRMAGVQAAGAAPIAAMVREGRDDFAPVLAPETLATAIRIGNPVNWPKAIRAIKESNGTALAVSDESILSAQRRLARQEGLFVEPASASPIAGLEALLEEGTIGADERVVCVTTGTGLKDPNIVIDRYPDPIVRIDADIEEIGKVIAHERS